MSIHDILYQYWGYKDFRPLQEDIIQSVLEGKDTLALLPTGGGKSICYQVPALALDGMCVVVSPLIALIKDQVDALTAKNIPALMLYSGMSFKQVDNVLKLAITGNYKFLYVSPERLETKLFLEYLPAMEISMIAVDEAHCISQWGYDFRPPYLRIANFKNQISNNVPVLALTASATKVVQKDICEKLEFQKEYSVFQKSFTRANLSYSNIVVESKINKIVQILQRVPGSAIVYCGSRKRTQEIASLLVGYNINADFYHAGLSNAVRTKKQQDWIDNKIQVIVSTNAFGMGIDKPDVRVVIHADIPDCLENYYQEAGRAGRDEKKAYAVLLYNDLDIEKLRNTINIKYPPIEVIKKCYIDICNFLQLPQGANTDVYYDFDISEFGKRFNYDAVTAVNCIKLLEQNDLLQYTASLFLPSTALFTCTKQSLIELETTNAPVAEVAKSLLRMYGGIWDYPCFINEKNVAYILKKDLEYVITQLYRLDQLGIIEYVPVKDTPQINLLQERIHAEQVYIDAVNYTARKKNYEAKVEAFINYVEEKNSCKSKYISNYFGVVEQADCGICDNCLAKRTTNTTSKELIVQDVLQQLQQKEYITADEINSKKNAATWHEAIRFLINENLIVQKGDKIVKK